MRRPGRWPPAAPCRALRTGCLPGGRLSGTGILWPAAGALPSKTLACSVRWYLNAIISTFIPFVLSQASPLEFVKIQIPLEGVTCLALAVIYILLYVRVSALPLRGLDRGGGRAGEHAGRRAVALSQSLGSTTTRHVISTCGFVWGLAPPSPSPIV